MKEKVALVIAVLMITSTAFVISTTTVTAPSTFSASPGATLSPTFARADTRIKFTVELTNDTTDNIDNVRIIAPSGSNFTQGIGGVRTAENLKLAADNLENAVAPLKLAGENLKLAADNKGDAGTDLVSAATNLQAAADALNLLAPGWENNVASQMGDAATYLTMAGDNMAADSENFTLIAELLDNVASKLHSAAGNAQAGDNMMLYDNAAAENLDNAAARLEDAADALRRGSLRRAGENLVIADDNFENASTTLSTEASSTVGLKMSAVGTNLKTAGQALKDAADYENAAGYNLEIVENYLLSAGGLIELADTTDLKAAGDNLENVAAQIGFAADNMQATDDNILQAGDSLSQAAIYLATAATQLGAALGGDELEDAMEHENAAAENLGVGDVDLGTAGDQLIAAADDLSAAASTILSTANALVPATWDIAEGTNYVQFNTLGENENWLNPGETLSFVFLWTTDNITIENTYAITIASNKEGGAAANWITEDTITLTVDGEVPTLTINVTQVGVTPAGTVNVVGTALDNAKATITITASETLLSLENVYVENSGGTQENFLPPITMTTTDNIVYTGTFTVGNWDDNVVVVRVSKIKDLAGNENAAGMENTVTVDTRAPVFVPPENSGLGTITVGMRENVVQAGTGTVFRYVDNDASKNITIRVEDNIDSAENGKFVTSVTVDTASATRSAVVDNLWSIDPLTLSVGFNSVITVTATDRTGNTVSDNIENIFIDTQPPTIAFNTIAGKTWTSGVLINDNMPQIKVTITDPGYPTSGLGVAYENLYVYLNDTDNIDNINQTDPYGPLDNKSPWDPSTGIFENLIDNAGSGLVDGTYWIIVKANDNLRHANDNENWVIAKRSFKIDTSKPTTADITFDITVYALTYNTPLNPFVQKDTTVSISGTIPADEVGGVIKVYVDGTVATQVTTTTTSWSTSITLTAGQAQRVEVTLSDVAGNESAKKLYGYFMADGSAPTVTITSPTTGISTDAASVEVTGSVSKDTWEDYADLTVKIQVGSATPGTLTLAADGSFTISAALAEGPNTITVTATDEAGNVGSTSVTVTRTVTPYATYVIIIVIVGLILAAIAIFRKR